MTQGDLVSPTIFNIVMDAVIRVVLLEVCRPQEEHHGLFWVAGEHNIVFYSDYSHINRAKSHLSPDNPVGSGHDVQEGGDAKKS